MWMIYWYISFSCNTHQQRVKATMITRPSHEIVREGFVWRRGRQAKFTEWLPHIYLYLSSGSKSLAILEAL